MICPNCKNESNGAKWCERCGTFLEFDDIIGGADGQTTSSQSNPNIINDDSPVPMPQYQGKENTSNSSSNAVKIFLAIIIPLVIMILAFVVLVVTGVVDLEGFDLSSSSESQSNTGEVLNSEGFDSLIKKGKNYISMGDYDSAESTFKAIVDRDEQNDEAAVLYQILYNYNRALEKLESGKYKDARDLYEKIPAAYINYEITDDVEKLEDEIVKYESANSTFENLKEYMDNGDYDEASEVIDLIDEAYLSEADVKAIDRYRQLISNETKVSKPVTIPEPAPAPAPSSYTWGQAESLIYDYCVAYVSSVNTNDFSYVSQYIRGQLSSDQYRMVEYWNNMGAYLTFNYVTVNNFRGISSDKWEIDVTESETINYSDGTSKFLENNWTYTIERMGSEYYLTAIK